MNLIGIRNLKRVREILSVLVLDSGFGYILDQWDLGRFLPLRRRRRAASSYAGMSGPRRLRLALGQLGPTFIKLGQVLSARGDLLPASVVTELRHLQDEAPELPFEALHNTLVKELGTPVSQRFLEFDAAPLSAASFGQVHAAKLRDGREVTVKVLRPGVEGVVEADLQIISDIAHLLHWRVPALQRYDLPSLVRQFSAQLEDQLIYTFEAHNADRLRKILQTTSLKIRIPEVIWELTTRRVLTTERLYGRRVDRLSLNELGFDRAAVAAELGKSVLHQVFVEGFFHGDPHQGNVLFGNDGIIILLDFGIVGYLDPRTRWLLADLVRRIYNPDIDGLIDVLSELGNVGVDTDITSLRTDLTRIVSRFMLLPRRDFPMGELLLRTLRVLWLNHMRMSPELSLAAKALFMTEAICAELDPDFDFRELARPVIDEAHTSLLSSRAILDRAERTLVGTIRHLIKLPAQIDRILSLLQQGNLRVYVEDPGAPNRWNSASRSVNRLAVSILAGSLLIFGGIQLIFTQHVAHLGLGLLAIAGAVTLALIVIAAVLRPGRV